MGAADRSLEISNQVSAWLAGEFEGVGRLSEALHIVAFPEHVGVLVQVTPVFGGHHTKAEVSSVVAMNIPVDDAVLAYVGSRSDDFELGNLCLSDAGDEENGLLIDFRVSLIADSLNRDDLYIACRIVGSAIPSLRAQVVSRFGGRIATLT